MARVPNLQHISLACDPFDGGNPGSELYTPRRVQRTPVASLMPRAPLQGLASVTSSNIQSVLPPSPAGSSCSDKQQTLFHGSFGGHLAPYALSSMSRREDERSEASSRSSSPGSTVSDVSTASVFSSASTVASMSSLPGGAQRHLESWKTAQMSPRIVQDRGTECAPSWSQGLLGSPRLSQQGGSLMSTNQVTRQSGPFPSVSAPSNLGGWRVSVSQAS